MQGSIERPPVGVYLNYRFLGARVPERWREWVRRDIDRPGWYMRQRVPSVVVMVVFFGILSLFASFFLYSLAGTVGGLILGTMLARRRSGPEAYRRQMLAYQLGEGPVPFGGGWTFRRLWPYLAGGLVVGLLIAGIVVKFFS